MKKRKTRDLVLSALFVAIGFILPFLTGQIPQIGRMLLPMHLPVMLCGIICGPYYGLIVGFITPILRSLIFTMPPMLPVAVPMAFELATYGLISGLLYFKLKKNILSVYISLVIAMVFGRIVLGIADWITFSAMGMDFTFQAYLGAAFGTALPGIILQLIIVPLTVYVLMRTNVMEKDENLKVEA